MPSQTGCFLLSTGLGKAAVPGERDKCPADEHEDDATIIRSGYISQGEQLMIGRKGAVGDILGYFFDAKGDVVTDIKIHNELIGLPLSSLKTIPVRVGVAGGENKAEAIAAAMKGGYINALVTDQDTAAAILRS